MTQNKRFVYILFINLHEFEFGKEKKNAIIIYCYFVLIIR